VIVTVRGGFTLQEYINIRMNIAVEFGRRKGLVCLYSLERYGISTSKHNHI
jgi:hypothetical protein